MNSRITMAPSMTLAQVCWFLKEQQKLYPDKDVYMRIDVFSRGPLLTLITEPRDESIPMFLRHSAS